MKYHDGDHPKMLVSLQAILLITLETLRSGHMTIVIFRPAGFILILWL